MSIKRIKHSVIFIIMFFAFSHLAHANLEITEINYNPEVKTNHLWIKVFNNTSDEVDLTLWSVADYDGTSWHYHTINADGSSVLPANSYAIVAKASSSTIDAFKSKNPDISLPLFYGNLTIENEGVLGLSNDKKTIVGSKSYGGVSLPSDTSTNNDTSNTNETSSTSTGGGSSSSGSSTPKEVEKVYNIATKIISPKVVTAGVPFVIDHATTGKKKEKVIFGKFVWNFGDGMMKSSQTSDSFEYTYQYPGEYVLTLSYYESSFNIKPDASDRITIKVIPSGITISSVGTHADPFIEIENNSSYEMSLRGWVVKGTVHSFIIPEDMIILPNKKLKISPRITGFDFNDLSSISIVDSSGQIFAIYPSRAPSRVRYSTSQNSQDSNGNMVKGESINNKLDNAPQVINLNDLGASAVSSDGLNGLSKGFYAWLGLALVLVIGITSVIFLRHKDEIPDYIDGEISAKDITIIE